MNTFHESDKCRAKDKSACRFHGSKLVTKEDVFNARTAEEFHALKARMLEQHIAAIPRVKLETAVVLDGMFHLESSKRNGEWQQGWLKDEAGNPVAFVKVHDTVVKDGDGEIIYKGISLCDIEVNPEMRKSNASLAVFRVLKQHFNVTEIWCGATFSDKGLKMYNKLRGHELATGETVLKLQPYYREDELTSSGTEEYIFVQDWKTLTPKYAL